MVRLKERLIRIQRLHFNHFNSTMVRLKVEQQWKMWQAEKFQFHYGTIKSNYLEISQLGRF